MGHWLGLGSTTGSIPPGSVRAGLTPQYWVTNNWVQSLAAWLSSITGFNNPIPIIMSQWVTNRPSGRQFNCPAQLGPSGWAWVNGSLVCPLACHWPGLVWAWAGLAFNCLGWVLWAWAFTVNNNCHWSGSIFFVRQVIGLGSTNGPSPLGHWACHQSGSPSTITGHCLGYCQ